jgi:hypothetical protein
MNPALWLLIGLSLRAWLRYLLRSLRTLKGALLAGVGLAVFLPWLALLIFAPRQSNGWGGHDLREAGPALLLFYCFMNVVFSSGERAIYFPPAEVNFLFPGPFDRRELLVYKIASTLILSLPTALFMTLALHSSWTWFAAAFVGMLLIVVFMHLFGMSLNLLAVSVGARLYTGGRRIVATLAVLLIGAMLLRSNSSPHQWQAKQLLNQLLQTPAWQIVSRPLRSFFDVVTAEQLWPDLVQGVAVALSVNLVLLGVIFVLDAHYLEASAAVSARIYAKMQRLRRGGMGSGEGLRRGGKVRMSLPMLPWVGGVGPLVWRQMTTAARGADRLLLLIVILGVAVIAPMLASLHENQDNHENILFVFAFVAVWLTVFMTSLLPFDFRGDIDRLALLKTLPLPPWRLAIGQILTPVLLMTVLQVIGLGTVVWNTTANEWLFPVCAVCAAFAPPINFLLFSLDNLLFLIFPTRLMAASPGDFQTLGRNVLFMAAKMIVLSVVLGMALVAAMIAHVGMGAGWRLAALMAWPIVGLAAASLVPLVAWAFMKFDVGRDTPA